MLSTLNATGPYIRAALNRPGVRELSELLLTGHASEQEVRKKIQQWVGNDRTLVIGLVALHTKEKYYRSAADILSNFSENCADSYALQAATREVFKEILQGTNRIAAFQQHARAIDLCTAWPSVTKALTFDETIITPVLRDGLLVNELRGHESALALAIARGSISVLQERILSEARDRAPLAAEDLFRNDLLPWVVTLLKQSNSFGGALLSPELYRTTLERLDVLLNQRRDLCVTRWHRQLALSPH